MSIDVTHGLRVTKSATEDSLTGLERQSDAILAEPIGIFLRSLQEGGDDRMSRLRELPGKPHPGERTGTGKQYFHFTLLSKAAP